MKNNKKIVAWSIQIVWQDESVDTLEINDIPYHITKDVNDFLDSVENSREYNNENE